jgi:hypothetical protein
MIPNAELLCVLLVEDQYKGNTDEPDSEDPQ